MTPGDCNDIGGSSSASGSVDIYMVVAIAMVV